MPFPIALMRSEMKKANLRFKLNLLDSISYDDNYYTMHTSYLNSENKIHLIHFRTLKNGIYFLSTYM